MLALAWKEVSRRRSRALLSVLGFLLVALLIASGICLGDAIRRATTEPLRVTGADLVVMKRVIPCAFALVKRPKDLGAIPMEDVAQISALPGVRTASGSLVVWWFRDGLPAVVTGVVPGSVHSGPLKQYQSGERCCVLEEGRLFDPSKREVILDRAYASQIGVGVGETVTFGEGEFAQELEVVGILKVAGVAVIGGGQAYVPLRIVQQALGEGAVVVYVFVGTDANANIADVTERIEGIVGEGCHVSSQESLPGQVSRSAAMTAAGTTVFVVLILCVGGLLMIRASLASVRERVVEIGVLRAIGWRRRHVVTLLGYEMMFQGLMGAVPGALLGYGLSFFICTRLNLSLPATFNSYPACATTAPALDLTLLPRVQLSGLIATFVLTVAVALMAGVIAGNYAARRPPMASLRQP